MRFYQEPPFYVKGIISDLQGAWEVLRYAVASANQDLSQLLLPINEAMNWESVRNLERMRNTFLLVQSVAQQLQASDEIMSLIEDVRDILYEALSDIQQGKMR